MSLKNFRNGRTRQTNNREIIRKRDSFSGGMSMDGDGSKLDNRTVSYLENFIGFDTELRGRKGTELFADETLPYKIKCIGNITNGQFAHTGVSFGDIVFIPSMNASYSVVETDGAMNRLSDEVNVAGAAIWVRSRQNASYFHGKTKRLFLLLGGDIWFTNVSENTADFPKYKLSEWTKISHVGVTGQIVDTPSKFHVLWDVLYLINAGGIFRIDINEKSRNIVYYRCNEELPISSINSVARTGEFQYTRRYIVTNSRLDSSALSKDRTEAIVLQETPPRALDGDGKDFSEINTDVLFGSFYRTYGLPFTDTNMNPYNWESKKKQMFLFYYYENSILKNQKVYVDLEHSTTFGAIINDIQKGLSAIFPYGIVVQFSFDDSKYRCVVSSLVEHIKPHIILPIPPGETEAGFGNDIANMLQFNITQLDEKPIVKLESIKTQLPTATHYSVYSTLDVSTMYDKSNTMSFFRVVNDPNLYVWAGDFPVACSYGFKSTEIYSVPGREPRGLIKGVSLPPSCVGSMWVVFLADGNRGFVSRSSTQTNTNDTLFDVIGDNGGLTRDEILGRFGDEEHGFVVVGSSQPILGKITKSNGSSIFTSTSLGFAFSQSDIGKTMFINDTYTATITGLTSQNGCSITGEYNLKDVVCVCINTDKRDIGDVSSDEMLTTRARSFPLRSRFFVPLPRTSLGIFALGFVFVANRGFGDIYYGSLADVDLIGYHKDVNQMDNTIQSPIILLSEIGGTLSVKTENSTYRLVPTEAFNGGNPKFNESYLVIPPPLLLTNSIGLKSSTHMDIVDNGHELVLTNEPAVRIFNGDSYSDNIAYGKIQESYVEKYDGDVIIKYVPGVGIIIWGVTK